MIVMSIRSFRDAKPISALALMCLLYCGLIGCSPFGEMGLSHPDEMLFDRAMNAVEQKHFDVAHITLQTLINTYPDSEYADKARSALQDPRIADCTGVWTSSPAALEECSGLSSAAGR